MPRRRPQILVTSLNSPDPNIAARAITPLLIALMENDRREGRAEAQREEAPETCPGSPADLSNEG